MTDRETGSTPDAPDPIHWTAREPAPFLETLGVRVLRAADGEAEFELTIDRRHQRTLGLLHGGVTAALLDAAMGGAVSTRVPDTQHVVTVQLNVNYIRPGFDGERLLATGEVRHLGRQTAVARGEVRTAAGHLVAQGTGTFMAVPRPQQRNQP